MNEQPSMEKLVEQITRMVVQDPAVRQAYALRAPADSAGIKRPPAGGVRAPAGAPDDGVNIAARDPDELARMKAKTNARIGVGKAGPRLRTSTLLRLRADHASARDAVRTDVDQSVLDALGLPTVQTLCRDKNEFLTRPDLGRQFSPQAVEAIRAATDAAPDVLIYASDGLSSTAVAANLPDILPVLTDSLRAKGIRVGRPFFVKYGRVGAMDPISEATGAQVTCVLIGERPGLATAKSMSAYIAYRATVGMPEARRTVVSNIHDAGTAAVEAGAYIADVIESMLREKKSGTELRK
ncbi:MAG: ethanolamine ammonia-lyase subunit EutC [Oscillospiraceae bacterium]|nr:ethanolamine ammonia-lyase subunit EutC [Oscillospiraceae bacterium]